MTAMHIMSDSEAIEAVRSGGRCQTVFTAFGLKVQNVSDQSPCREHSWRTVACDFETDVWECRNCGEQRLAKCDFDEDVA